MGLLTGICVARLVGGRSAYGTHKKRVKAHHRAICCSLKDALLAGSVMRSVMEVHDFKHISGKFVKAAESEIV